MTAQLSLLAPTAAPAVPAGSETGPDCFPGSELLSRSDVAHVYEHKAGPFIELVDGKPSGREYRILELNDGRLFFEFTGGGERQSAPPAISRVSIAEALRAGMWREVRP